MIQETFCNRFNVSTVKEYSHLSNAYWSNAKGREVENIIYGRVKYYITRLKTLTLLKKTTSTVKLIQSVIFIIRPWRVNAVRVYRVPTTTEKYFAFHVQ